MILSVENGSYSYNKNASIIKKLNFSVGSGELMAVLGPNGAGKTTMLRLIMGLLRWQSGKSTIDGQDIKAMPQKSFWKNVSYVPQAKGAFASLTVEEMVLIGRTNKIGVFSSPSAEDLKKTDEVLKKLHIESLRNSKCTQISGGELQMVLIARAIVGEPEILILDEPESNLDFKNQLIVLDTLSSLAASGMCCIFNTHYPTHALLRASKSLIIRRGGEYIFGNTTEVVTEENIEKAFGVKTVIGEVETVGNTYKNIIPLKVTSTIKGMKSTKVTDRKIAVIALITQDFSQGKNINELLKKYRDYLIGRMGIPYEDGGVYIINITLDAPLNIINEFSHRLSILPGVNVKTTISDTGENADE